ncbi:MAG: MBL fold metallo-hydrolase [Cyanobacteria bacterium]|nr:MBL fold metallo-hydrolase [Cyanobacteriota bacterium]MDW8202500.1 MBL fold metallo-hydrolase [Cyanobacteriota bacterium SKYGB_h_bin112]
MYLTWLDSNSWLIEMGGQRILLDPWLVGPLVFGSMPWLFKSDRPKPRAIPSNIDLVLLSQGLPDHAHPPTLQQLGKDIPVVGSPNAAKVAQNLGFKTITTLTHGSVMTIADRVEIRAVPGSPIGPFTIENGYILRDLEVGTSLYYEPHGYHSSDIRQFAPINVVITPVVDLVIPFLGPIIQGNTTALQAVEWLQPQVMLPTAAGGDVTFEGLLLSILQAKGGTEEFSAALAQQSPTTQFICPKPGDRIDLSTRLNMSAAV